MTLSCPSVSGTEVERCSPPHHWAPAGGPTPARSERSVSPSRRARAGPRPRPPSPARLSYMGRCFSRRNLAPQCRRLGPCSGRRSGPAARPLKGSLWAVPAACVCCKGSRCISLPTPIRLLSSTLRRGPTTFRQLRRRTTSGGAPRAEWREVRGGEGCPRPRPFVPLLHRAGLFDLKMNSRSLRRTRAFPSVNFVAASPRRGAEACSPRFWRSRPLDCSPCVRFSLQCSDALHPSPSLSLAPCSMAA